MSGRRKWAALALPVVVAVVLLVWLAPTALYSTVPTGTSADARVQAISSTRTAFVAGLAGLAALGSLLVNARNVRIAQDTLEANRRSQDENARAQTEALNLQTEALRLQGEGHLTDRYSRAIEQLAGDKLEVRLGGIYALERVAVDSERDHPTVVEVLGAYVRERTREARPSSKKDHLRQYTAIDVPITRSLLGQLLAREPTKAGTRAASTAALLERLPARDSPETEVHAALTVLARLPAREGVPRADFRGAHLEAANLAVAHLERAHLRGVHLERAYLRDAHLERADLGNAHLGGADLSLAHLEGAYLRDAHLEGAMLLEAHLERGDLVGAHLQGARLLGAHLQGADLEGAHLEDADLLGAHLEAARLLGAHLEGADLSHCEITEEQLAQAHGDERTIIAYHLQRPAAWSSSPPDG